MYKAQTRRSGFIYCQVSALILISGILCYLKQVLLYFTTLHTAQLIVYTADQQLLFCAPKRKKYSAKILRVATKIRGAKFLKCVAELLGCRFCFCFLICVCVSKKSNILGCVFWVLDTAICLSAIVFWNITPCGLVNNTLLGHLEDNSAFMTTKIKSLNYLPVSVYWAPRLWQCRWIDFRASSVF